MKKYKIALMTAHIGHTDKPELTITPECQKELDDYSVDIYRFNNANMDLLKPYFIPTLKKEDIFHETLGMKLRYWYNKNVRYRQKTYPTAEENYNRLIAKLPKIEFYKLIPETYDYYIWCDSKFTLLQGWLNYILEMININQDKDMIVYAHAERDSILKEFNFMKFHMLKYSLKTLISKYDLAAMDNQVYTYLKNKKFKDDRLNELGVIIYSDRIIFQKNFLDEWYAHNFYFSIQDQLSFPYLSAINHIKLGILNQSVCNVKYVKFEHY